MFTETRLARRPDESLISMTIGLLGPASMVSVRLTSEITRIRATFSGPPMSTVQAMELARTRHTTIERDVIARHYLI